MPSEHQPPDVLAMVIAKAVHRDVATNRCFIQETFHVLGSPTFPLAQPYLVVYVALTEGYGTTRLKLRLVDVDEIHPPLFELEAVVNFSDPLVIAEVVFAREEVIFPEPGEYRFQLSAAGEPLRERRLHIVPIGNVDQS
jgi:hypothetical protein